MTILYKKDILKHNVGFWILKGIIDQDHENTYIILQNHNQDTKILNK